MGTQQVLLIVIGVIIVGIAITVGTIPAFQKGMEHANKDALTQDCLKCAATAQGYFRRPSLYGGGGNSFKNIEVTDIGMQDNGSGVGENSDGTFTVDGSKGTSCEIVGTNADGKTVTVTVYSGHIDDPVYSSDW
jgi:hypothetical protein